MFVRSCSAAQSAAYSLFCCTLQAAGAWFAPLSMSGTRCAVLGSLALGGTRPALPLNARLPSLHCKQMGVHSTPLVRCQPWETTPAAPGSRRCRADTRTVTSAWLLDHHTNPRNLCKCVVALASTQCSALTNFPRAVQPPLAARLGLLVVQARKLVIHLRHACWRSWVPWAPGCITPKTCKLAMHYWIAR